MNWSGKRKKFRSMLCAELRDRIDVHVTSYRGAHDDVGEAWITLDGEKVLGAGYYRRLNAKLSGKNEEDIYDEEQVIRAIEEYLNCSIEDALHAENELVRAFAMLDRRLGRRRLREIDIELEHAEVVRSFHAMRMSVT